MPGMFSPPSLVSDPDVHHGACLTHVPWCMSGSLSSGFLWNRWRGKRSRHSRRMRNPQFCVFGKRPMAGTNHPIARIAVYHPRHGGIMKLKCDSVGRSWCIHIIRFSVSRNIVHGARRTKVSMRYTITLAIDTLDMVLFRVTLHIANKTMMKNIIHKYCNTWSTDTPFLTFAWTLGVPIVNDLENHDGEHHMLNVLYI